MASAPHRGTPPPASAPAIQIYQTVPATIAMHTIEDHQLTALTNVSRPLTLAVAGASFGAMVGILPFVLDALPRLGTESFGGTEVFYTVFEVVAIIATIYFGSLAVKGERDAKRLVAEIRARARKPF